MTDRQIIVVVFLDLECDILQLCIILALKQHLDNRSAICGDSLSVVNDFSVACSDPEISYGRICIDHIIILTVIYSFMVFLSDIVICTVVFCIQFKSDGFTELLIIFR